MRVQILKDFVKQHFPATPLLDYALEVEKITTSKVRKGGVVSSSSPPTPPLSHFGIDFLVPGLFVLF